MIVHIWFFVGSFIFGFVVGWVTGGLDESNQGDL